MCLMNSQTKLEVWVLNVPKHITPEMVVKAIQKTVVASLTLEEIEDKIVCNDLLISCPSLEVLERVLKVNGAVYPDGTRHFPLNIKPNFDFYIVGVPFGVSAPELIKWISAQTKTEVKNEGQTADGETFTIKISVGSFDGAVALERLSGSEITPSYKLKISRKPFVPPSFDSNIEGPPSFDTFSDDEEDQGPPSFEDFDSSDDEYDLSTPSFQPSSSVVPPTKFNFDFSAVGPQPPVFTPVPQASVVRLPTATTTTTTTPIFDFKRVVPVPGTVSSVVQQDHTNMKFDFKTTVPVPPVATVTQSSSSSFVPAEPQPKRQPVIISRPETTLTNTIASSNKTTNKKKKKSPRKIKITGLPVIQTPQPGKDDDEPLLPMYPKGTGPRHSAPPSATRPSHVPSSSSSSSSPFPPSSSSSSSSAVSSSKMDAVWGDQSYYTTQDFLKSFVAKEVTSKHHAKFTGISFSYPLNVIVQSLTDLVRSEVQVVKVLFHFRRKIYDFQVAFKQDQTRTSFKNLNWYDGHEFVASDGTCLEDQPVANLFHRVSFSLSVFDNPKPFDFCNDQVFAQIKDHDFIVERIEVPPNSLHYNMIIAFKKIDSFHESIDRFSSRFEATSFPSLVSQHYLCKGKPKLIVIDGLNVGFCNVGTARKWSAVRMVKAVNFWFRLGHQARVLAANKGPNFLEPELLKVLESKNLLSFTPSGEYDDSYVISYAMNTHAYIVSNDKYRDFAKNMKLDPQRTNQATEFLNSFRIGFTYLEVFMPTPEFRFHEVSSE